MQAIILAAGLGTRLRPITDEVPKCMVSVNGIRIIDKQIDNLHKAGVKDIVVVGGYKADGLKKHLERYNGITFVENSRYAETNIATRELAAFNIPMEEYMDASQLYAYPAVFRYVKTDTYSAGTFIEMDYVWSSYYASTAVPQGWLLALPYLRDNAHVRLIVPSKMGHTSAQQYVTPYFYDITEFRKARS